MHSADSRLILPDPPPALKKHSEALVAHLRAQENERGFLSFADYMEEVLYAPGLGYYSAGLHKFGEAGDFVTAPELGKLFASCLANQVSEVAAGLDGQWQIVELGAGTGRMASDILQALAGQDSIPHRYAILERSADLRAVQKQTLAESVPELMDRIEWLDAPPEEPWRGILLANEIIDALAVERFRVTENGIEQLGVATLGERFAWRSRPAPESLRAAVTALQDSVPDAWPVGYNSEICLDLAPWLKALSKGLEQGLALFIDYGYPRAEYYRGDRMDGTLVCQYRHRAHFDPLVLPGLQDISAFVDFTALAEAAHGAGLEVSGYCSQAMFLMGCGIESMIADIHELPPVQRQSLLNELRELTLPAAMGEKFQCMGLSKGLDDSLEDELRGFSLLDLRHRL